MAIVYNNSINLFPIHISCFYVTVLIFQTCVTNTLKFETYLKEHFENYPRNQYPFELRWQKIRSTRNKKCVRYVIYFYPTSPSPTGNASKPSEREESVPSQDSQSTSKTKWFSNPPTSRPSNHLSTTKANACFIGTPSLVYLIFETWAVTLLHCVRTKSNGNLAHSTGHRPKTPNPFQTHQYIVLIKLKLYISPTKPLPQ